MSSVERRQGFVEEQESRAHQQCAADGDALTLAAGQQSGPTIKQAADIEQSNDALEFVHVDRMAAHAPPIVEILAHAEVRKQPALLEHIADPAPMWRHIEPRKRHQTAQRHQT